MLGTSPHQLSKLWTAVLVANTPEDLVLVDAAPNFRDAQLPTVWPSLRNSLSWVPILSDQHSNLLPLTAHIGRPRYALPQ